MIDKKTEADIRSAQSFFEFWTKLHALYKETILKDIITNDDEKKYLDTLGLMKAKYEGLKGGLEFRYMPYGRFTDPVSDILAVHNIRFISENNLKKLDDDWRDSYVFLNSIVERLKSKKRRLGQFNPVGVFLKRVFERRGSQT